MKKIIKVKASIRNGKKVRAHTRTIYTGVKANHPFASNALKEKRSNEILAMKQEESNFPWADENEEILHHKVAIKKISARIKTVPDRAYQYKGALAAHKERLSKLQRSKKPVKRRKFDFKEGSKPSSYYSQFKKHYNKTHKKKM